ncbi:discoidin domain-containing protein [Pectobacterium polonicum]|uniref:carbohydrate-binding protein n=1 Tax=Pectobacterium polonicum TaxID=2485124 RepID=UPI0037551F6F
MSVNGKTGNVVVTYADAGADAAGTADSLMTAHLTALDPHSQYFDETRGDTRYVQRSLANQSNGWLQLDASGKIPASMLTVLASRYVVVANQAARLALASSANLTICAQADIDQLFYLNGGSNPAVSANWVAGQSATVSGVSSVFGRTGAVAAQNGDYDADKITETATRKFTTAAEKTAWNAKQAALVSGTNIRSLFGQSLLGSGNLTPTPAQMGAAATVHTHTTADITDYTQKTQQLITASLEAGTGVTLGYNPVNGKTIISASGGSGGGPGYIVVDRPGAGAGQLHTFNISTQSAFNLAAFALKEEAGTTNVTFLVDDFNAASSTSYNSTEAVVFNGVAGLYTGGEYQLTANGQFWTHNTYSAGKNISIMSIPSSSLVPIMTSDTTPAGYTIRSSGNTVEGGVEIKPWILFDGNIATNWFSDASNVPTPATPKWISVELQIPSICTGYQITNRVSSEFVNSPNTWVFQGTNDGITWDNLHSVNGSNNNAAGVVRSYNVSGSAPYKIYRLLVTAKNGSTADRYISLSSMKILTSSRFILNSSGKNYTIKNGIPTEIIGEVTESVINSEGVYFAGISSSASIGSNIEIISTHSGGVKISLTPYSQILMQKSLMSANSWSQINSATLTATQTGNGKVRVAVTRDLVNWHVLRNDVWVDVGALSADTAGAIKLIDGGMTSAEFGAITAAQWTQLFASNSGVPDSLSFAFALDIADPSADVAAIDRLLLNVNNTSSWRLQNPAEVEIHWRNDSMTFRTMTAGNYKLAYQIP